MLTTLEVFMITATTGSVFLAGLITSFLPCTFPVIIGYIGLLTGDKGTNNITYTLIKTVFFFLGFTATFIAFGAVAGLFGQFSEVSRIIYDFQPIIQVLGGIFFIILGLILLQLIPLPGKLQRIYTVSLPQQKEEFVSSPFGAVVAGVIFATAWSPCIGPVLGGVLLLAATSGSVVAGATLMFVFCLGMLVTLSIIGILYAISVKKLVKMEKFTTAARLIASTLFILLGILFITGDLTLFNAFEFSEVPKSLEAYL